MQVFRICAMQVTFSAGVVIFLILDTNRFNHREVHLFSKW